MLTGKQVSDMAYRAYRHGNNCLCEDCQLFNSGFFTANDIDQIRREERQLVLESIQNQISHGEYYSRMALMDILDTILLR